MRVHNDGNKRNVPPNAGAGDIAGVSKTVDNFIGARKPWTARRLAPRG